MRNGRPESPSRSRIRAHVDALLPNGDQRSAERRGADRRRERLSVNPERRLAGERRGRVPRRETALGHFFNVAQLLMLALAEPGSSAELVDAALRRLWCGMREVERGNLGLAPESGVVG